MTCEKHSLKTACSASISRLLCTIIAFVLALDCSAQKSGQGLIDSLHGQLSTLKADTEKVNVMIKIAGVYCAINPDTAERFAKQAMALAGKLEWKEGIAGANNALGKSAVYKADFRNAEQCWNRALAIYEGLNDKRGMLQVIGNLGIVYNSRGDYARSLQNNFLALKYAEELDDRRSIAINYGNIGSTYGYLKELPKALEYDLKALKLFQELGDAQSAAVFMGNAGNVYSELKQYTEALQYLRQALSQHQLLDNREGAARLLGNIGAVYTALHKPDSAVSYFFQSLAASKNGGFKSLESNALISIGQVVLSIAKDTGAMDAGRLRQYGIPAAKRAMAEAAISYFRASIAIDSALGNLDQLQHNYHSLAEAQQYTGHYQEALVSHRMYTLLKDSVFSSESKIRIANLETQRELELKDKQIEIDRLAVAKKRNERAFFIAGIALLLLSGLIILRNVRLKNAKELSENKLQTFQARMNPHFIFNSLSSIQSLILDDDKEGSVDYLAEFSGLLRQVLDNSALSKVPLCTEIDMLRSYIELERLRFEGFQYEISVADDVDAASIEVPGMIVQPFVENAILHGIVGKGGAGRLDLTFVRRGGHILCTVDDNGIGRAAAAEQKARRNITRKSHGIAIATNRLNLLNDKKRGLVNRIRYTDKTENGLATGTTVVIELPVL